jgi:hypothetical protein
VCVGGRGCVCGGGGCVCVCGEGVWEGGVCVGGRVCVVCEYAGLGVGSGRDKECVHVRVNVKE